MGDAIKISEKDADLYGKTIERLKVMRVDVTHMIPTVAALAKEIETYRGRIDALNSYVGELHGQIDALKATSSAVLEAMPDSTLDSIIKAISDNGYEITINLFKMGEKNHE